MIKDIFKIIFLLVFLKLQVQAQDIQLTQFYAMPMYLNPAFTGNNVCSRVTLAYRNQWPGLADAYRTKMVSYDHTIRQSNWGVGLLVGQDEAGAGGLKSTIINPAVSYEAKFSQISILRLGLQPGIGMKSINFGNLMFGDQIYRGGNVATIEAPPQSRVYFDLGAGALYGYKIYWVGLSAHHLNLPNESLYNSLYGRLPIKYSLHAGAKFDLSKSERDPNLKKYIMPVFHYRAQGKFDQVDAGFYLSQNIFTIGLWYRGIPGIKAYRPGYSNNDALAIIVGFQVQKIKFGYSYDYTISDLAGISRGAHEINLSFQMCKTKVKKRKLELISCPKF